MRDLAVALSAYIYQSLCDSDIHYETSSAREVNYMFILELNVTQNILMTRYIRILIHLSVFPAVAEVETFSGGHLVALNKYH